MQYFVEIAGREYAVQLTRTPDGAVTATLDGRAVPVDLVAFTERELSLRIGDRVVDLTIEGSAPQLGLVASGRRTYVQAESERQRQASRASRAGAGGVEREVRSPMPGRVVKVLVQVGDEVPPGGAIAIVEAMKMENEVRARKGGTVARVAVGPGSTVEGNAVLVQFS